MKKVFVIAITILAMLGTLIVPILATEETVDNVFTEIFEDVPEDDIIAYLTEHPDVSELTVRVLDVSGKSPIVSKNLLQLVMDNGILLHIEVWERWRDKLLFVWNFDGNNILEARDFRIGALPIEPLYWGWVGFMDETVLSIRELLDTAGVSISVPVQLTPPLTDINVYQVGESSEEPSGFNPVLIQEGFSVVDGMVTLSGFTNKVRSQMYLLATGIYGDVNIDCKIDAADALLILKATVKKVTLNQSQKKAAVVTGNDEISATDALLVLKYAVNKIKKFPCQN